MSGETTFLFARLPLRELMLTHTKGGSALELRSKRKAIAELFAHNVNPVRDWAMNRETQLTLQVFSLSGTELIPPPMRIPSSIASLLTISSTFNSLFKVLFIFPSRYLFAIGFSPVFSFRWNLPPTLGCILKQPDSTRQRHCRHH